MDLEVSCFLLYLDLVNDFVCLTDQESVASASDDCDGVRRCQRRRRRLRLHPFPVDDSNLNFGNDWTTLATLDR